ncbi:hypothetical protein [Paraburkholderia sp. MM5384-R2]|uniref:hypothetical protein n=1 Tax=Paraburkholderia sp. MM5384-R2 TaxID=2723097 RepID=UPI00160DC8FB|nr:hypothetical protein [Paraburkholderia sp. MM5384-R2]MBB5496459.1 hypothetical protein [Paraburkholderia sp. MM5384-R2]
MDDDVEPELPAGFWDDIEALIGNSTGDDSELGGKLLSLQNAARAHRHSPNWTALGQSWIKSEILRSPDDYAVTYGWLTLKAAARTATSARTFTSGVLKQLRDSAIEAPQAYDLVEPLVEIRIRARDLGVETKCSGLHRRGRAAICHHYWRIAQ